MQGNIWFLMTLVMISHNMVLCRYNLIARIVLTDKLNQSEHQLTLNGYYTPLSTTNSFNGRIIYVKSSNGRSTGCSDYLNPIKTEAYVAMVDSAGCSLETKIRYAIRNNASGLIVVKLKNPFSQG